MPSKPLTVALVGNPNAGKSTLFNALSGLRQHVGNYPGVTVEMKTGTCAVGETTLHLIDLPGTYSLAARSPDEMVAVELLLGRVAHQPPPDVIVSVVDASNLGRHLYLTTQLMELGVPVVLAVNMTDVAAAGGTVIDFAALARETGLPVVPLQANKGVGLDQLKATILDAAATGKPPTPPPLPDAVEREAEVLRLLLGEGTPIFLARRLLLDVGGSTEQHFTATNPGLLEQLKAARVRLADYGCPIPAAEAKARYGFIRALTAKAVATPAVRPKTWTDSLDRVLIHKLWGTLTFLLLMFVLFQSIFVLAEPLMKGFDVGSQWLSGQVEEVMSPGPLRSLLTEGIIAGVGGVLKFLPQILILFAAIAFLEDCGYMTRAAFLMDRLMSRCGLSGKSFIPLLSSVACAVPGIMATRVIENRRDRLATILVAPLMSCSARLPVYSLLIAAFFTKDRPFWLPGLVLFGMYMIGFIVAPVVALLLRRSLLRGGTSTFVMELPAYKRPSLVMVVRRMMDAGWAFVRRAGTLILFSMILVWAVLYFPNTDTNGVRYETRIEVLRPALDAATEKRDEVRKRIDALEKSEQDVSEELSAELVAAESGRAAALKPVNDIRAEWKRNSYLGQLGRWMEPAFEPLGWDWKIGTATLASFPAREVIVGTMNILYATDEEDGAQLGSAIQTDWAAHPTRGVYGVPVALSVMVFFALCCQCVSTLAVIRRETRSWWWPVFTFTYMTALAYVAALLTFQLGKLIAG